MSTDRNDDHIASNGELTVLGHDTRIKGEMHFETGARICGQFEGKITSGGRIEIADSAVCQGEIEAERVVLDGRVTGSVVARQQLSLSPHAVVQGDITAGTLTVEEGATFVGQCSVGPEAGSLSQPAIAPRAEARPQSEMKFRPGATPARPNVAAAPGVASPEPKPIAAGQGDNEFRPPWRSEPAKSENGQHASETVRTA